MAKRKSSYIDLLRDPRWQKRRLEIMQRDGWQCCYCGDEKTTLNVHHKRYRGMPWEAGDDDLLTVCDPCHKGASKLFAAVMDRIGGLPMFERIALLGLLRGGYFDLRSTGTKEEITAQIKALSRPLSPQGLRQLAMWSEAPFIDAVRKIADNWKSPVEEE